MPCKAANADRILIVDDSAFNRKFLMGILTDRYDVEEAQSAEDALAILSKRSHEFSLILLDLVMPGMGGFGLLERMNRYQWIQDLPVIMVSSETKTDLVKRAYDLGVTDFIRRPYEEEIVLRRIENTLALYAKQRRMRSAVEEKYYENERTSNLMISILSSVVEFRNGESGPHILHIKTISWFLLNQILKKTGTRSYQASDIHLLCKAAALHDIGKIGIPDHILNKPGRLTEEEYEIMKSHCMIGAQIIRNLPVDQEEPLVKAVYEICRWHHERWDGRGYPDGLRGDEIPMPAQVVALADAYDALISERCYKPPYSHEQAINMILAGKCGAFNPILLDCMVDVQQELRTLVDNPVPEEMDYDPAGLLHSFRNGEDMATTRDMVHRVAVAQEKARFLADYVQEPCFFYTFEPSMLDFSKKAQKQLGLRPAYVLPETDPELLGRINLAHALALRDKAARMPAAQEEDYTLHAVLKVDGEDCRCVLKCRNIRLLSPPTLCGFIGIIRKENGESFQN